MNIGAALALITVLFCIWIIILVIIGNNMNK